MNSFSYPQGQVYGNYGYGNYGYNYQAQQPKIPTMNQLMSDDERKLIESRGSGLVLEITDVDRARAKCTHKNSQSLTVTPKYPNDPNSNLWECSQCHKVFEIKDWSESEVVDLVIEMMNVIDNIKLFIPYIAPDVGTALYSSYDLIETIPRLYRYMLDYKKKMWSAIDASRNPMQAMSNSSDWDTRLLQEVQTTTLFFLTCQTNLSAEEYCRKDVMKSVLLSIKTAFLAKREVLRKLQG